MKIAGIIKNSFVDYPGQIVAVIFAQGCNYDCFFCHNRALIPFEGELLNEEEVFAFLEKRAGLLDGVVISGGEPTLQQDLKAFIKKVKDIGYLIKLDTNGSRPEVIEDLIKSDLLDYVAMDYKAPFDRYDEICCAKCDISAVKKTMAILKKSAVQYELRTTYVPQLNEDDIDSMLKEISPIDTFALQHYRMPENYKQEHRFMLNFQEHPEASYESAKKIASKYVKNVILR